MIIKITADNFEAFLTAKRFSLILLDADWNKHKGLAERFKEISEKFAVGANESRDFSFGEIDVSDPALADRLKGWNLANVPAVAYFCRTKLNRLVIGDNQNPKEHVVKMIMEAEYGLL